jgi:hypothetical protein
MGRIICAVVGVLGVSPALAAPAPKEAPPILYYPVRVGDESVMAVVGDRGAVGGETSPWRVTESTTADGVTTVTVADVMPDGQLGHTHKLQVSGKGVCVVERSGKKVDPPVWSLKLPARPGDSWEVPQEQAKGKLIVLTKRVAGEEEIETPAGKFRAIRVDVGGAPGAPYYSEWHAPGRGCVKIGTERSALALKSFTPGK